MSYLLLSSALAITTEGAAISQETAPFETKEACVGAMQALTGKVANAETTYPSVVVVISSKYANGTVTMRYVCAPTR